MTVNNNETDRETLLRERAKDASKLRQARITNVLCYPDDEGHHHWCFDIETIEGIPYCVWVNGDLEGTTSGYLQIVPYTQWGEN